MSKYFKYLLIFVIFFNCLFVTVQDSFANFRSPTVGPRDRIRNYDTGTEKSIIEYTYSKAYGFSCYPDGLKYKEVKEISDSEALDITATVAFELVSNLLLAPFLCVMTLKAARKTIGDDDIGGLLGGIGLLASAFITSGLERLESMIYAEDDFNVDPNNPVCLPINIALMVSCITMSIIFKIKKLTMKRKLVTLLTINTAVYAIKTSYGAIMYGVANSVYDQLSLCGDDWLTYGNKELQNILNTTYKDDNTHNITFNEIKDNFPTKGAFFGSYKYTLNDCFQKKNADSCKKLFKGININNQNIIDELSSTSNKPYREYLYGGKEYAYTGCKDPRTERKYYGNTTDTDSQLYYFRGNDPANFACDRFLVSSETEYVRAYECCLEASQALICINETNKKYSTVEKENYTMCSKDASIGSCNIRLNVVLPSIDNKDVCKDLKEQLNKVQNDKNIDTETFNEINDTYKSYCKEGDTWEDMAEHFVDGAIDVYNTIQSATASTIAFKIIQSPYNENKYCVETYNLCPYNFKILGGSEEWSKQFMATYENGYEVKKEDENCKDNCKYNEDVKIKEIEKSNKQNGCVFDVNGNRQCTGPCFNSSSGKVSACYNKPANFCQLDRHCVLIPKLFEDEPQRSIPYIDKACMDFIGSSHNFSEYKQPLVAKNTRLLTAPFVECFVETFKNLLLNRAGHTRCTIANDYVDENNECQSGEEYKKGEDLDENSYPSPFKKLQNYFYNIVKILLTLFVMLYGFNMIILNKGFSKEEILKTILTIVTVSYFTLSNSWVPYVFNGIYSAMNYFSSFAMEISITDKQNVGYDNKKYSGCYFFKHNEIPNNYSDYKDRGYLAIFDTLDCKLFRYFGFSNEYISSPPILSYFISGLFSFGLTLILILPFLLVMLSLIFYAIKIAFQFIVNSLILTLLLFMAPIMIPMYLFDRTKKFFDSWIKKLYPCVFGTIFTIMSLSFFLLIFDKYFVGDAVFYGTREPIRDVYCGKICKISANNFYYLSDSGTAEEVNKKIEECINGANGKVIDLSQEAPICASMFNDITTNSGSTLFDFVIDGFAGFPSIYENAIDSFSVFLSMIFLLVIIFIFEQFTNAINDMNKVFGDSNMNTAINALPNLQKVLNKATHYMTKMSNTAVDIGSGATSTVRNALHNRREVVGGVKQFGKRFVDHTKINLGGTVNEENDVSDEDKVKQFDMIHLNNKDNSIKTEGENK